MSPLLSNLKQRLRLWAEKKLGSLLLWAWLKYGQPRLDKAVTDNVTIEVKGKKIPVAALAPLSKAVPIVTKGIADGMTPEAIMAKLHTDLGHTAVNVVAGVLSILFPGIGTGIGVLLKVIVFMHDHTVPMTQEEENKWFDRFGIKNT